MPIQTNRKSPDPAAALHIAAKSSLLPLARTIASFTMLNKRYVLFKRSIVISLFLRSVMS